jgi:hypothetical protein
MPAPHGLQPEPAAPPPQSMPVSSPSRRPLVQSPCADVGEAEADPPGCCDAVAGSAELDTVDVTELVSETEDEEVIEVDGVIEGLTEMVDVLEGVAPIEREGVGVDVGVGVPEFEFETVGDGVLLAVGVLVVVGEGEPVPVADGVGESVPVTDGVGEGCAPCDSDAVGVGVPEGVTVDVGVPEGVAGTPPTEPVGEPVIDWEGVLDCEGDIEGVRVDVSELVGDAVKPVDMDGVGVPDGVAEFEGVGEVDGAAHAPPVGGTPASEPDAVKAKVLEVTRVAPSVVWFLTEMAKFPTLPPTGPVPSSTV